ncbi:MAG: hypothetical protein HC906_07980 [Bacteroidales bacterium]|nr:hypothetical protein [Bacteroidales bacterium]
MGYIGVIKEFINMPQNPLFRIMKGKREMFIPVNEEFILGLDHHEKTVSIQMPEGLIDIYE